MTLLTSVPLSALAIEDESDFEGMPLYPRLARALLDADVHYRVAAAGSALSSWGHVALLNHGFWTPEDSDDVLEGRVLTADVVAHRAWHHLAAEALGDAARSPEGLMLGESIASAFDAFMLGDLLTRRPQAAMLESQLPVMMDAMADAGLADTEAETVFAGFAEAPRRSFADLRSLLYGTGVALWKSDDVDGAARVLESASRHALAPVLHHYRLATWVLYARAYASTDVDSAPAIELAAELHASDDPLELLVSRWL